MAEKPPEEQEVQIELIPSMEPRLGREYVNYAQVAHSPWDFTIRFCQAPSLADIVRLKRPAGGKIGPNLKVEIPSTIELIVSPEFLPKIIEALKINYEKYLKTKKKEGIDEPGS